MQSITQLLQNRMEAAILDSGCQNRRKSEVLVGRPVSIGVTFWIQLCWVGRGVGGWSIQHRGVLPWIDRPPDRRHRRVACRKNNKIITCKTQQEGKNQKQRNSFVQNADGKSKTFRSNKQCLSHNSPFEIVLVHIIPFSLLPFQSHISFLHCGAKTKLGRVLMRVLSSGATDFNTIVPACWWVPLWISFAKQTDTGGSRFTRLCVNPNWSLASVFKTYMCTLNSKFGWFKLFRSCSFFCSDTAWL